MIQWAALGRALLAVTPIFALAFITGDSAWIKVGIVAISAHIAAERTNLMPLGVLLHGAAILCGFSVLFYSLRVHWHFVVCAAGFAALTIVLMRRGAKLRSLGNFTFLPSLYLACEAAEGLPPAAFAPTLATLLPYVAGAIVPAFVIAGIRAIAARPAGVASTRYFSLLARPGEGDPLIHFAEMMTTVGLSVGLAAAVVEWQALAHGQWVIWSATSVVTGDVDKTRLKVRERLLGACAGVPLGMLASFVIPHTHVTYAIATMCVALTLVAFTQYIAAFLARCAFVALALMLAGNAPGIAAERVVNVFIGGQIGLLTVLGVHAIFTRRRQADRTSAAMTAKVTSA